MRCLHSGSLLVWISFRTTHYIHPGVRRKGFHCITHPLQKSYMQHHIQKRQFEMSLLFSLCPLTVQATITAGPVDTNAEYLSNVSFNCTARGIPVPDFTWTVDSGSGAVTVMELGQISITTVPMSTQVSTLTLMSVEPSLATYTCNASNLLGSDSSAAILDVQGEYSTV